jgi:hypothetical protein
MVFTERTFFRPTIDRLQVLRDLGIGNIDP